MPRCFQELAHGAERSEERTRQAIPLFPFRKVYNPDMMVRNTSRGPVQLRVPFLSRPVAAGDAVKNMTQAVGIKPCSPCERRRQAMNRRLQFVPMRAR